MACCISVSLSVGLSANKCLWLFLNNAKVLSWCQFLESSNFRWPTQWPWLWSCDWGWHLPKVCFTILISISLLVFFCGGGGSHITDFSYFAMRCQFITSRRSLVVKLVWTSYFHNSWSCWRHLMSGVFDFMRRTLAFSGDLFDLYDSLSDFVFIGA